MKEQLLNEYYKTGIMTDELISYIPEFKNFRWKKIYIDGWGYTNYSVSDSGIVRNDNTDIILKPFYRKLYLVVKLCNNGEETTVSIHRLVAKAFVPGESILRNEVDHIDGVKEHNNSSNLEWVTRSEQIIRAYKLGLIHVPKGEDKENSIYTNEFVIKLCGYMELGLSLTDLSLVMGVEKSKSFKYLVDGIRAKNRWVFISQNFKFPTIAHGKHVWVEKIVREVCFRISEGTSDDMVFSLLYTLYPSRSKKKIRKFIKQLKMKEIYEDISNEYF